MLGLVTAITNLAGTWVSAKAESTKATAEAKATALKTAAQSTADWERIMAEASKNSWKDEWLTIVFSIPLILVFLLLISWALLTVHHSYFLTISIKPLPALTPKDASTITMRIS